MDRVKLGDRVKDRITGVKGIAIGITHWMYGCTRVTIQPEELKDGKPVETCCCDEPQLEIVKTAAFEAVAADPEVKERLESAARLLRPLQVKSREGRVFSPGDDAAALHAHSAGGAAPGVEPAAVGELRLDQATTREGLMTARLETGFDLLQRIRIVELDRPGIIKGIWISETGIQYQVRYFWDGVAHTEYFYAFEIEAAT